MLPIYRADLLDVPLRVFGSTERDVPDDLPALWNGKSIGVLGAEVVTVRLGGAAQGSEHGHRVGVDVREGGHSVGRTRDFATRSTIHFTPP